MTKKIGFIGLGNLGLIVALRLAERNYDIVVYDIRKKAIKPLIDRGARPAASPCDVASEVETVYLCLPTPQSIRDVCVGNNGLIEGSKIKICVDLSTTGPAMSVQVSKALANRDIAYFEAPVSGGPSAAAKGSLAVMAAGPEEVFERIRPTLRVIGKNTFYIGKDPGLGQMMKLTNNLLAASALAVSMEAVVCGVKAGLDPQVMIEIINVSSGRNTATIEKFPKAILTRTFDFGAKTEIIYKDLKLLMEQAETMGVPMWVGNQVTQLWSFAMSQGDGPKDFTNLIKYMEKWAGVEVKSGSAKGSSGEPP